LAGDNFSRVVMETRVGGARAQPTTLIFPVKYHDQRAVIKCLLSPHLALAVVSC